jgi:hypothetical protein
MARRRKAPGEVKRRTLSRAVRNFLALHSLTAFPARITGEPGWYHVARRDRGGEYHILCRIYCNDRPMDTVADITFAMEAEDE